MKINSPLIPNIIAFIVIFFGIYPLSCWAQQTEQSREDILKERYQRAQIVFNGCKQAKAQECSSSQSSRDCSSRYIESFCICIADGMQGHQLRALREFSDYYKGQLNWDELGNITKELVNQWVIGCRNQ